MGMHRLCCYLALMRLACRNLGLSGPIGAAATLALGGPSRSTHTGGPFTHTPVPNSRSQH
eukprot:1512662-Alexandrium_andersonii.AAC.1